MASTYLTRTQGTGTSTKIATFSAWLKKGEDGSSYEPHIFDSFTDFSNRFSIGFEGDFFLLYNFTSGTNDILIKSNRVFRDSNAFYNLVVEIDTTQATASDRVKIYINGEQETSFSSSTYPSQNLDIHFLKSSSGLNIGRFGGNTNSIHMFNGVMAHVHFIDGTAYDADTFGETDATTGIWKPKTAPSVTYGTNGFFLKFENSGAFGTDSSGNANNFTVNGTMTQTIDTPSNVFATMNPLASESGITFTNGNTTVASSTDGASCGSTLAVTSGKYYFECKYNNAGNYGVGLGRTTDYTSNVGYTSTSYNIDKGGNKTHNSSFSNIFTLSDGDIIGFALDCDNQTIHFSQNGNWYNNNNSSTTLDPNNPDYSSVNVDEPLFPRYSCFSTNSATLKFNFGNGYFGTTAVSSAQNPDDGIGIFEYDVPAGYRALCTKSINAEEYD